VEEVFLILLGVAWALGTPIIALIALVRTGSLRDDNARLAAEIAQLRRQLDQGTITPAPVVAEQAVAPLPPPFATEAPVEELPPPVEQVLPPPAPVWQPETAEAKVGWEQRLGGRAFIWIGAVTLALAAIFLVRHSIEEG
jgi:uncharacterized membrane protein